MIPQRWIEAYLRFLLKFRGSVVIAVTLMTLFFAYHLSGMKLHTDFFDFYPKFRTFADSFALGAGSDRSASHPVIGDIYIAPDVARANATRFGRGVREEFARLVVHGTLHVLGHDHPDGTERTASPMWRRQERLLASATVRRALSGAREP